MRLRQLADTSGRLAISNDEAAGDLSILLEKWFAKHFLKGIKLPALKAMHGTDAFDAFSACLAEHGEEAVIAILRKLDPHRHELFARTRMEMEAHIRDLAAGRVQPAPKPKRAKTDKGPSGKPARVGGLYERSRL
jgi:hypothetical protein